MRSAVLVLTLAWASPAFADDSPEVELEAVQASSRGGQVDSQFAGLKRRFAHSGFSYSSYRQVGSHSATLKKGESVELKVLHSEDARVTLVDIKGPSAYELHITASGGTDLDTVLACGASGIVELDHQASKPDANSALLLSYHLHCPPHPEAAATADAGS